MAGKKKNSGAKKRIKFKSKTKTDLVKDKSVKLHPLSPFWENIENINSKLIPYAVFALTIIIIIEIFVELHSHLIEELIHIIDYLIIVIFVIDLCFIYYHVRKWSIFFKRFWLDILAVFPFVLFFRGMSSLFRLFRISDELFFGQTLLHEGLEVRKAAAAARTQRIAKYLRLSARFLRVITKSRFFTAFRKAKRRR